MPRCSNFFYTDLEKARLQKLQDEYMDELEIIKEEFDTERAIMIDQHNAEMNDIADILFAMDQNYQEREAEAKSEFQSMRDEIKNKVHVIVVYSLAWGAVSLRVLGLKSHLDMITNQW